MRYIRSYSHTLLAALYDYVMEPIERCMVRTLRQRLLSMAQGRVLEIGAGTGANFPFYDVTSRVVATEPKRGMQIRAQRRSNGCNAHIQVVGGTAERLPVRDASVDVVVSTFVLCSVAHQPQAVAELWRVLRPGGVGLFLEHIRSEHRFWNAVQRAWNPIQSVVGDGCCLTRDTVQTIESTGFVLHTMEHLGGGPFPVRMVWARRPGAY